MFHGIRKNRRLFTAFLAALGLGVVVFYAYCDTSCSYLQGDFLGLDLKYAGMIFMAGIILLTLLKQGKIVTVLLSAAIGAEFYLISFQFQKNVFCPYCLVFAAVIFSAFLVNYESEPARGLKRGIYRLGTVSTAGRSIPLAIPILLGYLFTVLTFSGSVTPAYGLEKPPVPSFGKGPQEVIIFTDYFCSPCRQLEPFIEPVLEELLSEGRVKVSFVDVPMHKLTPLYARYFLYAYNSAGSFRDVLHSRKVLFVLAAGNSAPDEEKLAASLQARGVKFQALNLSTAYDQLNRMIRRHNVRSTPTCVIKYSDSDVRTYSGTDEIRQGLTLLQSLRKPQASVAGSRMK